MPYQSIETYPVHDDPVDNIEPIEERPANHRFAECINRLLVFPLKGRNANNVGARYVAMINWLKPELLNGGLEESDWTIRSQSDIARATGLSKAAISKYENELRDEFGFQGYSQRSNEVRETYRQTQLELSENTEPLKIRIPAYYRPLSSLIRWLNKTPKLTPTQSVDLKQLFLTLKERIERRDIVK